MNSLIIRNIKNFPKNKKFKNFFLTYFIIFILFFSIIIFSNICNKKINDQLNQDGNRLIIISEYNNDSFNKFINQNKKEIEHLLYKINYLIVTIDENEFNIQTLDDDFDLCIPSIKLNPSISKITSILNNSITNIHYNEEVSENSIVINQYLAKNICEKSPSDCSIYLTIKDYLKIDSMVEKLNDLGLDANANLNEDTNITIYKSLYEALNIFFILYICSVLLITIFISSGILQEQKKNIKIYHFIGYDLKKITWIYIITDLFYILIIYLAVLLLTLLLLLLISLFMKELLLNYFISYSYIPFLIIVLIKLIITIILVRILNREN